MFVDVRGHKARVDVVDSNVRPLVSLQLPALNPREGTQGYLGHDVGGFQPEGNQGNPSVLSISQIHQP